MESYKKNNRFFSSVRKVYVSLNNQNARNVKNSQSDFQIKLKFKFSAQRFTHQI